MLVPSMYVKEDDETGQVLRMGINLTQQLGYPLEKGMQGALDAYIFTADREAHCHVCEDRPATLEHAIATGKLEIMAVKHGSGVIALRYADDVVAVPVYGISVERRDYCVLGIEGGVDHQVWRVDEPPIIINEIQPLRFHNGLKVGTRRLQIALDPQAVQAKGVLTTA